MQARELRKKYLEFFESKGALRLPSESLVSDDPTLLFIVAGMVPFKAYFEDRAVPPRPSVTTTQKCLRTKDIEDIGDISHCTFFEMLGNFSFGDYFQAEAIAWAWEFLTQVLKLDPQNLRVTIYRDDEEAFRLWREQGLPAERITRLGQKTNYWPANAIQERSQGPCGPCSEIFFDLKPELPFDTDWDGEGTRWLEIWNLVFTQYTGRGEGENFRLVPLPKRNIDTGMGLERTAAAINRLSGPFETDVLRPIIAQLETLAGKEYRSTPDSPDDIAFRRIADHIRATAFLLSDGVTPDRSGRGYVLRRLMRRAIVAGIRRLGFEQRPFLHEAIPTVIEVMGDAYPDLVERRKAILDAVQQEETLFRRTLQNGLVRLDEELALGELTGRRAFYLYETFGLPFEITSEIAAERGLSIDRETYDEAEEDARQRSRAVSELGGTWEAVSDEAKELLRSVPLTRFVGYETPETTARILGILAEGNPVERIIEGQSAEILLDATPFYAESGGQVGDAGSLRGALGGFTVADTVKKNGLWFHRGTVATGTLSVGDGVAAEVDSDRRRDIMRNHTATHLLHKALRSRLGAHVQQRGSLVAPDRLRFDFAHGAQMTPEELRDVENEVNEAILSELPVEIAEKPIEEARQLGAMMLFGEKYGDVVRVVSVGGDYSREFCGGTHVTNTARIGPFRLVSEGSAAAGVRRVEALTGRGAEAFDLANFDALKRVASLLGVRATDAPEAVERLLADLKATRDALTKARQAQSGSRAAQLVESARTLAGLPVVVTAVEDVEDGAALSALVDDVLNRLKSGAVLLAAEIDGKIVFVAKAAKDAVGKGAHAGHLVKAAAQVAGGGGGGRPDFAQAGGKDPDKLGEALAAAEATLTRQLEG
ncbi:MAG: alanine--tRNA ligase [Capsulimonadales bacterium]|nr:alanine--tRNA ligase [Capsulimonadales bacterium]